MRPQPPPPHLFLQECDSRAVIFAFVQGCDSKRLIFCWFFSRRLSRECADSKRVRRLGMRPGRWSPQKLFCFICKSVILNGLVCAGAKGGISNEGLPEILERGDFNGATSGILRVPAPEDARTIASEDTPLRGARAFRMHIGCKPIPSMFYIFYRASKAGLWKCGRTKSAALKTAALRSNLEEKPCPRRAGDRAPATDPRLRDCAVRPQKNRTLGNEGCGTRRLKLGRALTLCFALKERKFVLCDTRRKFPRVTSFLRECSRSKMHGHPPIQQQTDNGRERRAACSAQPRVAVPLHDGVAERAGRHDAICESPRAAHKQRERGLSYKGDPHFARRGGRLG